MGILANGVIIIVFIFFLIGFVGVMWDISKNKTYRRHMIYKSIRRIHNKKQHKH